MTPFAGHSKGRFLRDKQSHAQRSEQASCACTKLAVNFLEYDA